MPVRMCVVCRGRFEKAGLNRVICGGDGEIRLDKTGKAQCRGAYICGDCLGTAQKKRALERVFGRRIGPEVYERIIRDAEEK